METAEKLYFLQELIRCSYPLYFWIYDDAGHLHETDCPNRHLPAVLEKSGCLDYAFGLDDDYPVILGSMFGTLWGGAFEQTENGRQLHLIGPMLTGEIAHRSLEDAARRLVRDPASRSEFMQMFSGLPIIPLTLFQHYVLMLHYCVTGERAKVSDFRYQERTEDYKHNNNPKQRDRNQVYMAEKQLLYHVREGDLNFHAAHARAAAVSSGIQISVDNPTNRAKISTMTFTSLCVRAAIEGGLSPDTAYTLGDTYIQGMLAAMNVSELTSLSHDMYEDFIRRVHKARSDMELSKPIRDCCEYIQLHPEDDLSISALARQFGYSDYYFSRRFKKETGETVRDYIDAVRIERARMLLETTDEPISEIAQSLHYCSSTHFSDVFKSIIGKLPNEYRKQFR